MFIKMGFHTDQWKLIHDSLLATANVMQARINVYDKKGLARTDACHKCQLKSNGCINMAHEIRIKAGL